MNFAIRPLNLENDISAITAIYGEAVAHGTGSFELNAPSTEDMIKRAQNLLANDYPYLVAVAQEEGAEMVLGFAYVGPHKSRLGYSFTGETSIYLAPHARGKGVGTALLEGLIGTSERRGLRQLVAVIGDSANIGSILLHAKCGFEEVGRFSDVGYKFDRWLDVVFMQKSVGDGNRTKPI